MEESVIMSGVGGQGIQVASKLVCVAATAAGKNALHFIVHGGQMRGGLSECFVAVADGRIGTPPLFTSTRSVIAMHPQAAARGLERRITPGGLYLVNSSLIPDSAPGRKDITVFRLPASEIATGLGNVLAASMVAIGAYVSLLGLLPPESLAEHVGEMFPPYRSGLIELNRRAIMAGATYVRQEGASGQGRVPGLR